jgi:hypothetical protein
LAVDSGFELRIKIQYGQGYAFPVILSEVKDLASTPAVLAVETRSFASLGVTPKYAAKPI